MLYVTCHMSHIMCHMPYAHGHVMTSSAVCGAYQEGERPQANSSRGGGEKPGQNRSLDLAAPVAPTVDLRAWAWLCA